MRLRQILIVHESSAVRELIRRYLLSELTDVHPREVESVYEAEKILRQESWDLVISGNRMRDGGGQAILDGLRRTEKNLTTPFLLLTSFPHDPSLESFFQQGPVHILGTPFISRALASVVNSLAPPRELRRDERLHIPNTHVTLFFREEEIQAWVVNVSAKGFLCDFPYDEDPITLYPRIRFHLLFPPLLEVAPIEGMVKFLRLHVLSWGMTEERTLLRTSWEIVEFFSSGEVRLQRVLAAVRQESQRGSEAI